MYGQIIGDNLGATVEFDTPEEIRTKFPNGVRELIGGGPFDVAPGQATDDSELALALARSITRCGGYSPHDVYDTYLRWGASFPPDIGNTCSAALQPPFEPNFDSKSNGALMRVSPIAIAYANGPEQARQHARTDARMTHPNDYPVAINGVYAETLARIIAGEEPGAALITAAGPMKELVETCMQALPGDVHSKTIGFVRYAFNFACYYAVNGTNFEEDLVEIVDMGGDTDTNAAIAGAFLGAVYGEGAIPERWRKVIDNYKTADADRPEEYSTENALRLVDELLTLGR